MNVKQELFSNFEVISETYGVHIILPPSLAMWVHKKGILLLK